MASGIKTANIFKMTQRFIVIVHTLKPLKRKLGNKHKSI